jgi:hypothetical protein
MLDHITEQFGYVPSYGALGSYGAIYFIFRYSQWLQVQRWFKSKCLLSLPYRVDTKKLRWSKLDLSLSHTCTVQHPMLKIDETLDDAVPGFNVTSQSINSRQRTESKPRLSAAARLPSIDRAPTAAARLPSIDRAPIAMNFAAAASRRVALGRL